MTVRYLLMNNKNIKRVDIMTAGGYVQTNDIKGILHGSYTKANAGSSDTEADYNLPEYYLDEELTSMDIKNGTLYGLCQNAKVGLTNDCKSM